MIETIALERSSNDAHSGRPLQPGAKDDVAMLKAAADPTRDLNAPRGIVYWSDMLFIGAAWLLRALLGSWLVRSQSVALVSGLVAIITTYRAWLVHSRAHSHQEGVGEGVSPCLEPCGRSSASRSQFSLRGRA